ncbi:MAG: hypothetical protein ABI867_18010 [Kofleriaceae bacterium]
MADNAIASATRSIKMLARVLIALACFTPPAIAESSRIDVSGLYHSNWNDVRLVQDGDHVTGTYVCCRGGTIEGRITEGRTLHYRWTQPGGQGLGVWTIENGRLDGTWGVGQSASNGGRWNLERAKRTNQIAN